MPFNEVSVNTVFLGIASSELGGAEGLLDSFKSCVERAAVQTDNLVGITTDGESANSGKNTGLWRLLQRYLGKDILTVWCVCHRSDLALEAVGGWHEARGTRMTVIRRSEKQRQPISSCQVEAETAMP